MAANARYYTRHNPERPAPEGSEVVNGAIFTPCNASKVVIPGFEFVDAHIRRDVTPSGLPGDWIITEAKTGYMMHRGRVRAEAIANAKRALELGYKGFAEAVETERKKGHYAPYYQDALDMGYPTEVN
jgi:hypothetical protein